MHSESVVEAKGPTVCRGGSVLPQGEDTAAGHGEVGAEVSWRVQGVLDATEEVVGLKDQYQLARHVVQELGDLGKVPGDILLNILHLQIEKNSDKY